MDFTQINWLAVVIAAASTFVVGGIWYGPVFGRVWMAEMGFTEEHLAGRNQAKIFGGTFVFNLIMATTLALFLGANVAIRTGAMAGLLSGFGLVMASLGVYYLFEEKSTRFLMINGGFAVLSFTLMGTILGAMS